jgi:hypothetical protein
MGLLGGSNKGKYLTLSEFIPFLSLPAMACFHGILWYICHPHKVRERIHYSSDLGPWKLYFKWWRWSARKCPDWLLLQCGGKPIEILEYLTDQFTYDDFKNSHTCMAFSWFNGYKDPILECIHMWHLDRDMWDHAVFLEDKYGLKLEDHEYYDPQDPRLARYQDYRLMKKREMRLELVT